MDELLENQHEEKVVMKIGGGGEEEEEKEEEKKKFSEGKSSQKADSLTDAGNQDTRFAGLPGRSSSVRFQPASRVVVDVAHGAPM
ncbi:hypothetical protein LSTR_LSTR015694 [Laodelphax striatellus]|uniref:Uncharacterized protein n=1 Tax=Laodelphax striatellus TaxID=195883 RepID=A0A482WRV0_LAOST|nr:hypothetical protein LSTR_LSTR015694 [Laodelphax striatellus]